MEPAGSTGWRRCAPERPRSTGRTPCGVSSSGRFRRRVQVPWVAHGRSGEGDSVRVMQESPAVFVPLTVVIEFEWVMRGFYQTDSASFCQVVEHLLGMPHVTVERCEAVNDALDLHRRGLDFADALHWSCSGACTRLVSFDDRRLVRRVRRLGPAPEAVLPREL